MTVPSGSRSPWREIAPPVVEVVRSIAAELHPRGSWIDDLDVESHLERDAGLDSLSRMELLARLEARFERRLPEPSILEAESIGDLVHLIGPVEIASLPPAASVPEARTHGPAPVGIAECPGSARGQAPISAGQLLGAVAAEDPDRVVVHLLEDGESDEPISAGSLYRRALELAGVLARRIRVDEPVAIMLPTGRDFLESFFAVLFAGGVPVPLAPPARLSQIEDHVRRQTAILANCRAALLLTAPEIERVARPVRLRLDSLREISTVEALRDSGPTMEPLREPVGRNSRDLALLQYTSGSTGDPKGVMLSNGNLLANVAAIARRLETAADDVYVSWLPLYHDMGLIGGVLHALYCRIPLVLLPPQAFLARPVRWLRAIQRFGGTMTVAPNFAYEICHRRLTDADLAGLDLQTLRLTLNGAEAVSPDTIAAFTRRFEPYGYRASAMAPCYGLAENTLAVSCARMGRGTRVDTVARELLLREERAVPVSGRRDALRLVSCGPLMHGVEVRLVDRAGVEVGEREVGRIQFRGDCATAGYYRNERATRELIEDGWRDSGDLGYRVGDELFVTGRAKDLVIRAGLNITPSVLEEAVGDLAGVRRGCVAVFGVDDRRLGSERLVVAAETRERGTAAREALRSAIAEASIASVGIAPDEVSLLAPGSLLKTSSGKLRRAACRTLFERRQLDASTRLAVWRQLARIWWGAAAAWVRRATRRFGEALYSLWCWALAGPALAAIWCGVLLAPRPGWRHAWARRVCRAFFRLIGPFRVDGLEQLPSEGPVVIAANHASYVDSMVLFAALPRHLTFVAKREFEGHPITRVLMRRLGTVFVDRSEPAAAAASIERLRQRAETGALAVFVEGTFGPHAGLRPFRLGAFQVAAEADCPVVPLVVNGSRRLLRDEQWRFRPSAVRVRLLPPVRPDGRGFRAAVALRDRVRSRMLPVVEEPDLAPSGHETEEIRAWTSAARGRRESAGGGA